MTLSKENPHYVSAGNPFIDWWQRHDKQWQEERLARWPVLSRALRGNIDNAGQRMAGFKNYFLTGDTSEGQSKYISLSLRMAMVPYDTVEEAREALEAFLPARQRQLRDLAITILHGYSIVYEGLPTARHDDEGIRKLHLLGEAAFPKSFSADDADCRDDTDPAYFQERGCGSAAKPLPFLRNYLNASKRFIAAEVSSDGIPILVNSSDYVREYFISCLAYMHEAGRSYDPEPERGDPFARYVTEFLTEILFFEELNPLQDKHAESARFARAWRVRLDENDMPSILKDECDRMLANPPEVKPRGEVAAANPFAHLRFFRNSASQYVERSSPDADSWLGVIANFDKTAQRNMFARLVGEPGRPVDDTELKKNEISTFKAIEALPLPYRVRNSGKTAVYLQFADWDREYFSLDPIIDALQAANVQLAFIEYRNIEDDGPAQRVVVDNENVSQFRSNSSPLWKEFKRIDLLDK